jgi:hypothetical protein
MRQRDYLRDKMERLIGVENNINMILIIQNNFDIDYACTIYEESGIIDGINEKLREKLFEKIIEKKNEFYSNELYRVKKDKFMIIKYIEEIEKLTKFQVDNEILEKFRILLKECGQKK